MFRMQAAAKGLGFNYARAPNLPVFVRTDEKRLRQILVNLLSNAIKFTSEGIVSFSVSYRSQVASFVVSDSGPGIALDEQVKIFEPFGRSKTADGAKTPGWARADHHQASDGNHGWSHRAVQRTGEGRFL